MGLILRRDHVLTPGTPEVGFSLKDFRVAIVGKALLVSTGAVRMSS